MSSTSASTASRRERATSVSWSGAADADRAELYRLLAVLLCLPDREALIREAVPTQLGALGPQLELDLGPVAERLQGALESSTEEELHVDYSRLFVGPGSLLAPPWGSVFLDGQGEVMGESTREVEAFYRDHGLSLGEGGELPDHAAIELEFLHVLASRAAQPAEASTAPAHHEAEERFRNRFVDPWLGALAIRIRDGAETPYLKAIGELLAMLWPTFGKDAT